MAEAPHSHAQYLIYEICLFLNIPCFKFNRWTLAPLLFLQNMENDEMDNLVTKLGYEVFRGSENDVLDRYYQIAKKHSPEIVLRITGDCPLIDYQVTDKVIQYLLENNFDYVNNSEPPTYPDGLDTEVFTSKALKRSWKEASNQREREHVTTYIRESGLFKVGNYECEVEFEKSI